MDFAKTKAPLGGEKTGENPTVRGNSGTKRCLLTEGDGIPLAITVEGANRHDMKMTGNTLDSLKIERPEPCSSKPQNLCLDKGFDYQEVRDAIDARHYVAHIRTRGEEIKDKKEIPGYSKRRWAVERTHSWMNRFRRLLIRLREEGKKLCGIS